jgi:hypothetical protein
VETNDFRFVTDETQISTPQLPSFNINSLISDKHGYPILQQNKFEGESAFLICSGPSFSKLDKTLLKKPGILTAGVNNSVFSFRPNLWFSADPTANFLKSIWLDPTISKYVPLTHIDEKIFNSETNEFLDKKVADCPNMNFFNLSVGFDPATYFKQSTICWGNNADQGGKRSVMLIAIRVLHYLGIKNIYLLGCDFKMDRENPYHFQQYRHASSIKSNMSTYEVLKSRFESLKPYMDADNFHIYNCNPESDLKVFPYIPYEDAISKATPKYFPVDVTKEPTDGLYDRAYLAKLTEKNKNFRKVTFSTLCTNLKTLSIGYIKNIEDYMGNRPKIEFILVNCGNQPGLDEWVETNLKLYIKNGTVKYLKSDTVKTGLKDSYEASTGEIFVNLGQDCYLESNFFKQVNKKVNDNTFLFNKGVLSITKATLKQLVDIPIEFTSQTQLVNSYNLELSKLSIRQTK